MAGLRKKSYTVALTIGATRCEFSTSAENERAAESKVLKAVKITGYDSIETTPSTWDGKGIRIV